MNANQNTNLPHNLQFKREKNIFNRLLYGELRTNNIEMYRQTSVLFFFFVVELSDKKIE